MMVFSVIKPLYVLSGFMVGLLVGQTGVGGGSLMTPLLVLLFGIHPATAVGTDLLYAAATKTAGTLIHGMHGTVDWRITGRLAAGSIPAAVLTLAVLSLFNPMDAKTAHFLSEMLGAVLILTAIALVFRNRIIAAASTRFAGMSERRRVRLTILTGVVLGVL